MLKISVIVPVYNAETFLNKCIDSIRKQSYEALEIILINDGSLDGSGMICESYKKLDSRVKVIHQKNAGVSAARNAGLDIARGDFVTFVDSDDYIQPDMYQKMIEYIINFKCDLVVCDCMKKKTDRDFEPYIHEYRGGYYSRKQLLEEYYPQLLITNSLEYPLTISNYTCLFRNVRTPRYKVGVKYSEDWLFGCQLMLQINSFYYMKGQMYYIYNCCNMNSATHTPFINKWNDYMILHEEFQKIFSNNENYDFKKQLNEVLLFMVCNECADILNEKELSKREKMSRLNKILYEKKVRNMFKSLIIKDLEISLKLKILIWCYAHPWLAKSLVYYKRKK